MTPSNDIRAPCIRQMPRKPYLFMDGVHLTEAGQNIDADYFYNLLAAPSEISFLAETAVQTTFQTLPASSSRSTSRNELRRPGWNVWVNGDLWYLKLDNSIRGVSRAIPDFRSQVGMGVDYQMAERLARRRRS